MPVKENINCVLTYPIFLQSVTTQFQLPRVVYTVLHEDLHAIFKCFRTYMHFVV